VKYMLENAKRLEDEDERVRFSAVARNDVVL